MKRSLKKLLSRAAFASLSISAAAHAQVINLSTGLGNGVALAPGTIDPNWQTLHAGEITFYNRVVSDEINAGCACGIIPNASTGQWININGGANSGWPVGMVNETFRYFNLSGYDLATVTLAGSWAAMDSNLGLYLNGGLIPGTTFLFPATTPWTSCIRSRSRAPATFGAPSTSSHSTAQLRPALLTACCCGTVLCAAQSCLSQGASCYWPWDSLA